MSDKFLVIGLTGQSGAGKSTVAQVFSSQGVPWVDADKLAHLALKTEKCKGNLSAAFGKEIFDENGEVVRKALAKAAFSSKENTLLLNKITHPVIKELALSEFARLEETGEKAVLFDAPTLFESGLDSVCHFVISVIAKKDLRVGRIMARDNLTEQEAMQRLNAQHPDSFYTEKSRYVIENNSTAEELESKASSLFKEIFNG